MSKIILLCLITASLMLAGCVMNPDERFTNIEKRIEAVETELVAIKSRVDEVDQRQIIVEDYYRNLRAEESASRISLSNQDVQTALKNAGFYSGSIDGKIGPATKNAIKEFQKANNLKPDGVVGSKTKSLLARYLAAAQSID